MILKVLKALLYVVIVVFAFILGVKFGDKIPGIVPATSKVEQAIEQAATNDVAEGEQIVVDEVIVETPIVDGEVAPEVAPAVVPEVDAQIAPINPEAVDPAARP
ncbi:MAG: hypothetical protein LBT02_04095 [Rickettsiales bacterium]|jgi:hypothetical protein|nr:hypothetical protein [Rickettsiales bacterium]